MKIKIHWCEFQLEVQHFGFQDVESPNPTSRKRPRHAEFNSA